MVKSSRSCFKIITCATDSVEQDEYEPIENKQSADKRGWSFRKRSARHRVLSNTVVTESPSSSTNKESPESANINFNAPNNFTVPEKISVWTSATYPSSNVANPNAPEPIISGKDDCRTDQICTESACRSFTTENVNTTDPKLEESSALVIQNAIRVYLAQRALLKLRNVVKLQAAVRGHLVRNQAMGTLRCVQAITKMQALVRARRARMSLQGLVIEEKSDEQERNSHNAKEGLGTKESRNYSPTEKLLTNGFARQLMGSAPKKKQIHIKCDPLQPDSSWKWLERWMSVSSSELEENNKPELSSEYLEQGGRIGNAASEVENESPAEIGSATVDLKSNISETAKPLDSEENSINTYGEDNFVFQASRPLSSAENDIQQPWGDDMDSKLACESSSKIDSSEAKMIPAAVSEAVSSSILNRPEVDNEQPKRSMKRPASEQPETEGKKYGYGSRKGSNPAFVAVQSKFEGLTSAATSNRSISSTSQDVGVESKLDRSALVDFLTKSKEPNLKENSVSHEPRLQIGGSDCGSVLSITSTLDSPDRSEVGVGDFEQETGLPEVTSELSATTDNAFDIRSLDVGLKTDTLVSQHNSSVPASFQSRNDEIDNLGSVDITTQQVEPQPKRSASGVHFQVDTVTDRHEYRSSPEGSPTRSHVTIPESYGTPSSQVSTNAKRSKLNGSGGTQSRKSQSVNKRTPSSRDQDSGARSSTEQLPKDSKTGKRRSSFGTSRTDHVDQESRDSSSSSLPSYMQATESARAKALANVSPRASPDVQDKEVQIKKRHSLPGTNGKQGSPRMQRSMSQVQQNAKNGSHSPHEKKWQR